MRRLAWRWKLWTALPGDVIYAPDRDVRMIIHSGRPGALKARMVTGMAVTMLNETTAEVRAPIEPIARHL